MSLKNIEQLRNVVLDSLENLVKNKIEIDEASIIAKSAEAVMSSLKLQLQYCGMRNEEPNITFLQDCNKGVREIALPTKQPKLVATTHK